MFCRVFSKLLFIVTKIQFLSGNMTVFQKTLDGTTLYSNMTLTRPHYLPVPLYYRSVQLQMLRVKALFKKAEWGHAVDEIHMLKDQSWSKNYKKTNFSNILWTHQMKAESQMETGHHFKSAGWRRATGMGCYR